MTTFLQFALLGLGTGSIVALLGLGLVVIYRGSGTINVAQGAFALLGAYTTHELREDLGVGVVPSIAIAVVTVAALGVLVQLALLRPLQRRSPLVRVIATLGVLSVVQSSIVLRYGSVQAVVGRTLPEDTVRLGDLRVGENTFWLLGIAVLTAAVLTVISARTRVGLAVSASAANQRAASALGFSPDLLAGGTWALGGALAAASGAFLPSLTGNYLSVNVLTLTIISALAAALLGGFRSYPLVLVGGLLLGVVQAECTNYVSTTGVSDAVPFAVLVIVLVVRGQGLPVRGTSFDRLPAVGAPLRRPVLASLLAAVAALVAAFALPTGWDLAVTTSVTAALVALSVVVVTGYAGQLSLAQFALGGVGAWTAGRLVAAQGWPFEVAAAAGVLAAVVVGLAFGVPALRTRGVNLAVVTLGLGFAAWSLVFNSTDLTSSRQGESFVPTSVAHQTLFGISIDPLAQPGHYAALCVLAFAVVALAVSNLRSGSSGRRLLSVRANERAAASLGVSVVQAKLYAFALGAAIAGLGGILYAFSFQTIDYATLFNPFTSISIMTLAVIGGIGYISGPLYGSLLAPAGIASVAASTLFGGGIDDYLPLAGGILLLVLLLAAPDGIARPAVSAGGVLSERLLPAAHVPVAASGRATSRVTEQALQVRGLTVRFGGVVALDDVSLTVAPGQVLGVLGPNGAGKTTLIDAITGYNRPASGILTLGGTDLAALQPHLRSRAGVCRSFQSLELFDDMTVRENLLVAADSHGLGSWLLDLIRPRRVDLPPGAVAAVHDMGLEEALDAVCDDLSYGRRRLVAIARSLATEPSVLLLDEPAAGLDEDESRALGELLRRLADERGVGVLLIEHDVPMVMRTADRIVVLDFGRQIAEGTPAQIRADPAVRAAYLGTPNIPTQSEAGPVPATIGSPADVR